MPEIMDYILVVIIAVFVPIRGYRETALLKEKLAGGDTEILGTTYRQTILLLWGLALAVLAIWFALGRSTSDLGFVAEFSEREVIAWALVAAAGGFLAWQAYRAGADNKAAQALMDQLGGEDGLATIMPQTHSDYRWFQGLSITAGITEEIIYRGYLIWFFSAFVAPVAAAALALLVFVIGHLYQRTVTALARVTAAGLALTLAYVLTGSLWPAIVLHALIDLMSNATIWRARQRMAQAC